MQMSKHCIKNSGGAKLLLETMLYSIEKNMSSQTRNTAIRRDLRF